MYLRHRIGATGPENADVEALKLEVTKLRQKIEETQDENAELKQKACLYTVYKREIVCTYLLKY